MWGLRVDPDLIEDLSDLRALGNERNQAHLTTTQRAQQQEHFVDARYQHRPQVVRLRALGWRYRFRCGCGWESRPRDEGGSIPASPTFV